VRPDEDQPLLSLWEGVLDLEKGNVTRSRLACGATIYYVMRRREKVHQPFPPNLLNHKTEYILMTDRHRACLFRPWSVLMNHAPKSDLEARRFSGQYGRAVLFREGQLLPFTH
jgi:hypothetical protein